MKWDDLERLSPEAQGLLAREREIAPAPTELRARVMTRARDALQVSEPTPLRVSRRFRPLLIAAALVVTLAAVSFAAWQGLRTGGTDQARASNATDGRTGPAPSAAKPAPLQAPQPQREVTDVTPEEGARPEEKGPAALSPRRAPSADVDALELALLQRARAAVARGEFTSALDALRDHQRRFPRGKLGEEREALRVQALVGLGRHDEARRARERFRDRYPDSVLSPRIEGTDGAR